MQLPTRRFPATRRAWILFLIPTLLCAGCAAVTVAPAPLAPAVPEAAAAGNCMQDVFSDTDKLNCTAEDVRVSQYNLVEGPEECLPGEKLQVKLQAELVGGAHERYDIGLFIAQDGGNALTGMCYRDYLAPPLASTGYDPGKLFTPPAEGGQPVYTGGGPFLTAENAGDLCGDIKQGEHTFRDVGELLVAGAYADTGPVPVDVICQDNGGADGKPGADGVADVSTCVSWDNQANASTVCLSVTDTKPNNKAKCNCSYVPISGLTVPKVAHLEVVKDLIPQSNPGLFDLLIDGAVASGSAGVGDGGSTGRIAVSAGTQSAPGADHTVGEAAHPGTGAGTDTGTDTGTDIGTDLSAYDISYACTKNDETAAFASGAGPGPVNLPLKPDDDVICIFTNRAIPQLHLVKEVSNDDGGTAVVADWTLGAAGARTDEPTDLTGTSPVDSAVLWPNFKLDTYTLSETYVGSDPVVPDGYTASAWTCVKTGTTDEVVVTDSRVAINYGDDITCTITNDDIQPRLKLVKMMNIQYGGTATAADFTAAVSGGAATSTDVAWDTFVGLKAGSYVASETGPAGYTASDWTGDCDADGTITLQPGDEKTCTITNSDLQPRLKLVKMMDIKYGGTATAADFKAAVSDGAVSTDVAWNTFAGLKVGSYVASETGPAGYTASAWTGDCAADGTITLHSGDEKTCTITNSDVQPKLELVKAMNIKYGGTATAGDFQAAVTDGAVSTDVAWNAFTGFDVGTYDVSETGPAGYTASAWSGDCTPDGAVALLPGDEKTCTITNSDSPATPSGATAMSWVLHDELTIEDIRPLAGSPAKVTFTLFKDKNCEAPWLLEGSPYAETVPITYEGSTGKARTLTGYPIPAPVEGAPYSGTFYWQATYTGDPNNPGFKTGCGHEITAIGGTTTVTKSKAGLNLGRLLDRIINRGGIEIKASGTTAMSWVLHDTLHITGIRPLADSPAKVTFTLFKDENCQDPWLMPGSPNSPYSEIVPITYAGATRAAATLTGYGTLIPGKFYWQAAYSGDSYNNAFTTACGHELTVIDGTLTPMDNIPLKAK